MATSTRAPALTLRAVIPHGTTALKPMSKKFYQTAVQPAFVPSRGIEPQNEYCKWQHLLVRLPWLFVRSRRLGITALIINHHVKNFATSLSAL